MPAQFRCKPGEPGSQGGVLFGLQRPGGATGRDWAVSGAGRELGSTGVSQPTWSIATRNTPTDLDPMRSTEPTSKETEVSQTKPRDADNGDPLSLTRTARQWLSFTHAHATQVAQLTRRPHDDSTTNSAFQHQTSAHLRWRLTG